MQVLSPAPRWLWMGESLRGKNCSQLVDCFSTGKPALFLKDMERGIENVVTGLVFRQEALNIIDELQSRLFYLFR